MRFRFAAACFLAACAVVGSAQEQLTNQSILKMHDAGMSDDLIVTTINAQPGLYTTSTDDLISLKKAGISDKVIGAMVVKSSQPPPPPTLDASPSPPPTPEPPATTMSTEALEKPRVYLSSASKGNSWASVRNQSMEMSRDFERDCPGVRITLNQSMADYTVALNHIEVGLIARDNQFQVADKNGDLISKTKEGRSIAKGAKGACEAIMTNWNQSHSPPPRSATNNP